jgi:hypothetical protein
MIIADFIEQKKQQIEITCNGKKPLVKSKTLVALLSGATNRSLINISQELSLNYGVIRKWKTEEFIKTYVKITQDELVELIIKKIQQKEFGVLDDIKTVNEDIKNRIVERLLGMVAVLVNISDKIYYTLLLKRYFNHCDCDLMENLLIESLKNETNK